MTKLAHFAGFDRKNFGHKNAFVFGTKLAQLGPFCLELRALQHLLRSVACRCACFFKVGKYVFIYDTTKKSNYPIS